MSRNDSASLLDAPTLTLKENLGLEQILQFAPNLLGLCARLSKELG